MSEINEGQAAEFSQPNAGDETPAAPAKKAAKKAPAKRARKATTKRRAPVRAGGHVLDPKTSRWVPAGLKRKGK